MIFMTTLLYWKFIPVTLILLIKVRIYFKIKKTRIKIIKTKLIKKK